MKIKNILLIITFMIPVISNCIEPVAIELPESLLDYADPEDIHFRDPKYIHDLLSLKGLQIYVHSKFGIYKDHWAACQRVLNCYFDGNENLPKSAILKKNPVFTKNECYVEKDAAIEIQSVIVCNFEGEKEQ